MKRKVSIFITLAITFGCQYTLNSDFSSHAQAVRGNFCNVQKDGGWWLWRTGDLSTDACAVLLNQYCTDSGCRVVSSGTYLLNMRNNVYVSCENFQSSFSGIGGVPFDQAYRSVTNPFRPSCVFELNRSENQPGGTTSKPGENNTTVANNQINGLDVFDEAMIRFMQERSIPSGTLAVMKDGQLLFSKGYGYLNYQQNQATLPDTLMRIASLSKPITSAAIKRLIQERRLNPDSSVFQLLGIAPASGSLADPRLLDVTVQHLLEHKGGWDSGSTFDPMGMSVEIANSLGINRPATCVDTIAFMLSQPLQFTPGTRSSYSNFGYCVLGRVIEKVTGQSYIDYVKGSILSPIGVEDVYLAHTLPNQRHPREVQWYSNPGRGRSVFRPNQIVPLPDGAFYIEAMDSHGGLIASSTALARFAQTYGGDGEPFTPGQTWIWFGGLPGTFSMLLWRPNGVTIAVLFNQNTDSSGLSYDDISRIMDSAASTIQW